MMHLEFKAIHIVQFRNYRQRQFDFREKVIAISGANGSGKTNLLDAIYYMCLTKSHFSKTDTQNATHGLQGFRIEAQTKIAEKEEKAVCILRETGKKELSINNIPYKKMAEHIGHFPCIMIAPDDIEIITGNSDIRRKEIDMLLSQVDNIYLQALIQYNRSLLQRNKYLKDNYHNIDHNLIDVYDAQLTHYGEMIYEKRKSFMETFIPIILEKYYAIAQKDDTITIKYESQLNNNRLATLLADNRRIDIDRQRTQAGIHKDDLIFQKNGYAYKAEASQGQRKSLLFAIKLAAFEYLTIAKNIKPIILLDDIFEKLDESRMQNLLEEVCIKQETQVFITDTHLQRIDDIFKRLDISYQSIHLD